MRRILLDTSAYSAFSRGHHEIRQEMRFATEVLFNPIVLGELRVGFRRGNRRRHNESLLETHLASPRVRVVPIDDETSHRYAEILTTLRRAGSPIPTNDIWIAAVAMQHACYVITTDRHFERVPQVLSEIYSPS